MKIVHLIAGVAVLTLAGCESFSDATSAVREKFAERAAPQSRTYAAEQRAVYDAVKTGSADMGYRFVRGGPAQGEYEAISGLRKGETISSARQIAMKVALRPTLDGKGTEVSVWLTEIIESDSSNRAGQATESPLRDTPQYDVLFRRIGTALGVPPQASAAVR
jgi:hypothetical protein